MSACKRKMFNYNFVFLLIFLAKNIICAPFHIDAPIVAVSNSSLEAIGIANKINQHFESVNKNDMFNEVTEVNVEPFGDPNLGKSMIKLNLNMNLEVENGKPQKMTLPQGDLMLMFVPNTRQVKPNQIENFMKSTNGLTQTAQTSGGVLFTSWLEKNSNGPIMARSDDTLPSSLSNDQDFNDISTDEIIDGVHEQIVKDEEIRKQWNQGQIPKFPFYHNVPTANIKTNMEKKENVLTKRTSELEELFEELKKMKIDKKDDILNKRTSELEQLFNNLKKKYGIDDGAQKEFDKDEQIRKQSPKFPFQHYVQTTNIKTSLEKKKYRIDDDPHDNRNSVTAGHLTRPVGQMSSTVQCSEINGETICKRKSSSCAGSFGAGCQEKNLVPFSQPQSSMNMRTATTSTTTRRPRPRPQQNFQRRTTSTTTTTTTSPPNLRELEEQRQVDEVMNMDPHSLADAFVDPMMMALGAMVTMAGAYMAIVMQETAAANAFAIAAASGKKKK